MSYLVQWVIGCANAGDGLLDRFHMAMCRFPFRRVSSVVEQRFCKPLVGSSNLSPGTVISITYDRFRIPNNLPFSPGVASGVTRNAPQSPGNGAPVGYSKPAAGSVALAPPNARAALLLGISPFATLPGIIPKLIVRAPDE
jgi:hypothetical protein